MKSTSLKLKPVDPKCFSDLGFLYGVMSRRLEEPWTNISHQKMPSWDEHVKFIRSEPYFWHWIITMNDLHVGVVYVARDRSVGIYVSPEHRRHGIGRWALRQVIDNCKGLRANINPSNEVSMRLFENAGFKFRRAEDNQLVYLREDNERVTTD